MCVPKSIRTVPPSDDTISTERSGKPDRGWIKGGFAWSRTLRQDDARQSSQLGAGSRRGRRLTPKTVISHPAELSRLYPSPSLIALHHYLDAFATAFTPLRPYMLKLASLRPCTPGMELAQDKPRSVQALRRRHGHCPLRAGAPSHPSSRREHRNAHRIARLARGKQEGNRGYMPSPKLGECFGGHHSEFGVRVGGGALRRHPLVELEMGAVERGWLFEEAPTAHAPQAITSKLLLAHFFLDIALHQPHAVKAGLCLHGQVLAYIAECGRTSLFLKVTILVLPLVHGSGMLSDSTSTSFPAPRAYLEGTASSSHSGATFSYGTGEAMPTSAHSATWSSAGGSRSTPGKRPREEEVRLPRSLVDVR
ncbi:hypothetical protein NMY22_g15672 [Coprinellus aureogranulatus]|nr:hypothetical protein NMY22_g15672 [Coprinellus aureogranulatus]